MSKKLFLISSMVILIVLTGCLSTEIYAELTSPIDMYAPFMSSVPGFPLEVELEFKGTKPKEISIKLETDQGIFLEWGSDMKVRDKGKSVDYTEGLVYWSPLDGFEGIIQAARIKLIVSYQIDAGNKTHTFLYFIDRDDDGMYVLRVK